MRVVFWGTPEFALPSLDALLESKHEVAAVVTQPDRPAGRGRSLRAPPVKELAQSQGLPVLQPEKARGDEFMAQLRDLAPEISIVAAYGQILRPEVLELPARGSYNVHASLLPKLRGAAPINWAIINAFTETGVTIMKMVERMDAGPIILQSSIEIAPDKTADRLSARLAALGAEALLEALELLEAGVAVERPQHEDQATFAPKLGPEDVRVKWALPADVIERWVRASDPWPGAWSETGGVRVRVFAPRLQDGAPGAEPGTVLAADPHAGLRVATGSGPLVLDEVQPAGKKRMMAVEWIRGRGIRVGDRFR